MCGSPGTPITHPVTDRVQWCSGVEFVCYVRVFRPISTATATASMLNDDGNTSTTSGCESLSSREAVDVVRLRRPTPSAHQEALSSRSVVVSVSCRCPVFFETIFNQYKQNDGNGHPRSRPQREIHVHLTVDGTNTAVRFVQTLKVIFLAENTPDQPLKITICQGDALTRKCRSIWQFCLNSQLSPLTYIHRILYLVTKTWLQLENEQSFDRRILIKQFDSQLRSSICTCLTGGQFWYSLALLLSIPFFITSLTADYHVNGFIDKKTLTNYLV